MTAPQIGTNASSTTGYLHDALGRLISKTWPTGATSYATTYTYKDHPTDLSLTSTQLASL